ncbi:MAG: RimK family alpha-L-glutamate ligase [Hyphomicrobium aestuarii]|nr:RimK family alpha-L-glutamate ligase [Hyphomicrobium aestuarii]
MDTLGGHGPAARATPPRIVLFVDERGGDWHARRLKRAFEARGAIVTVACLKACAFDTAQPTGLVIPGFGPGFEPGHQVAELPDAVFVRSIGDGSLEQITFRLGILHALEASGVRVWNGPRAIERSVDKSTATFLFQRAGIPVPATVTTEGRDRAMAATSIVGLPAVSKPMFGAQGVGIVRIDDADGLPAADDVGHVYHMQRLIEPAPIGGRGDTGRRGGSGETTYVDWRVLVSGGRVVAAMARQSTSWITNVHQGGAPSAVTPDAEMARLALAAAAAVGADYGGVDLIRDCDRRLLVLEVNSNPAWRGLQSVAGVDIADALARDLLAAIGAGAVKTAVAETSSAWGDRPGGGAT